jgi:hypothetical protein
MNVIRPHFCFILFLIPVLTGCMSHTVAGPPRFGHGDAPPSPPHTLAILPTTRLEDEHADLARSLRQGLFSAATELAYSGVELRVVDGRLASLASRMGVTPTAMPSTAMASPSVADLVLYSRIDDVSRLYLLIYGRLKVRISVTLVDTRTRVALYRNEFTVVDRLGGPAITLLGAMQVVAVGLFGMEPWSLEQTLIDAAEKIVADLPVQRVDRAVSGGLRLIDLQVELPPRPLRAGDRIGVRVTATPGCEAEASLPPREELRALREVRPGIYEGGYTVRPGDDKAYGIVEVRLATRDGKESLRYAATETPIVIDTAPPQRARVARWWPGDRVDQGLFLELAVQPRLLPVAAEDPRRYLLQRRDAGKGETAGAWETIGQTEEPVFADRTARRGATYEYQVVTEDAAGNHSRPGPVARVDFR